jgi:hypothetical protein
MADPLRLERLTPRFAPRLPDTLELALRKVLAWSGDPGGPPPPNNTSELATRARVDRANLSRLAKSWGVDLHVFLDFARTRWILASLRERERSMSELTRIMGYAGEEPVRLLLKRTVGCTLSQAWREDPEVVVGPLLEALGKTVLVDRAG